eukprot:s2528_g6.t1
MSHPTSLTLWTPPNLEVKFTPTEQAHAEPPVVNDMLLSLPDLTNDWSLCRAKPVTCPGWTGPSSADAEVKKDSRSLPPEKPADADEDTHPGLPEVHDPPTFLHAKPVTRQG